jgi:AcrR family transcriptional regulator
MSSRSAVALRRIPQQQRGRQRVADLLQAAACEIANVGYGPATMAAIAERAGSSIGSLYQFFPNKDSITEALRAQYVKELEKLWATLADEASRLTVEELVPRIIHSQIEFAEGHPGFLALFDAPPTANTPRRRQIIRRRIAQVILARKPDTAITGASWIAAAVQQIVGGMLRLYAQTNKKEEKGVILEEFKAVLTGYLMPRL